jgi:hypothetical protein
VFAQAGDRVAWSRPVSFFGVALRLLVVRDGRFVILCIAFVGLFVSFFRLLGLGVGVSALLDFAFEQFALRFDKRIVSFSDCVDVYSEVACDPGERFAGNGKVYNGVVVRRAEYGFSPVALIWDLPMAVSVVHSKRALELTIGRRFPIHRI